MSCGAPAWLGLVLVVVAVAAWRVRSWRGWLEATAAIALLLALAEPQFGPAASSGTAPPPLVIVLDASRSMLAADPAPSRFASARAAVAARCAAEPGRRIGVVAFAASAWIVAPATADHEALLALLAEVDPARVVAQGSDVAAGLVAAVELLPAAGGDLWLLTDGEWDGSEPEPVVAGLQGGSIRLETRAFGTGTAVALDDPVADPATVAPSAGATTARPDRVAALAPAVAAVAAPRSERRPFGGVTALLLVALLCLAAAHALGGAEP